MKRRTSFDPLSGFTSMTRLGKKDVKSIDARRHSACSFRHVASQILANSMLAGEPVLESSAAGSPRIAYFSGKHVSRTLLSAQLGTGSKRESQTCQIYENEGSLSVTLAVPAQTPQLHTWSVRITTAEHWGQKHWRLVPSLMK